MIHCPGEAHAPRVLNMRDVWEMSHVKCDGFSKAGRKQRVRYEKGRAEMEISFPLCVHQSP